MTTGSPESQSNSESLLWSFVDLVGISVVSQLLWEPLPTNKYLDKDKEKASLKIVCILFNAETISL